MDTTCKAALRAVRSLLDKAGLEAGGELVTVEVLADEDESVHPLGVAPRLEHLVRVRVSVRVGVSVRVSCSPHPPSSSRSP